MLNHFAFIRWLKSLIPFSIKIILIYFIVFFEKILFLKLHLKKASFSANKKIFLLLSTDYSNLGDHAMSYAHKLFLESSFPDYEIIEITVNNTLKSLYGIKLSLTKDDIITLKGGGNVGIEYFREELIRREIIKFFPNNKIIMFPQTVYFPSTKFGNIQFAKTISIFNGNSNFFPFFRDYRSYEIMKPYLNRLFLTPDIVFSLHKIDCAKTRNGALILMRNDVEGIYSNEDKKKVLDIVSKYYCHTTFEDTVKPYIIKQEDREIELKKIWQTINSSELVITDRLHGMIFAALLGTPCVVLPTYNHKLIGQYDWLKEFNYIKCANFNKDDLECCIKSLIKITPEKSLLSKLNNAFNSIRKVMNSTSIKV